MRTRTLVKASVLVLFTGLVTAAAVWLPFNAGATNRGRHRREHHPMAAPFLIFRALAPYEAHGRIALLALDASGGSRHITSLSCLRVHYSGGSGVCVVQEPASPSKYYAYVFDAAFTRGPRIELPGAPARVRVAPGGRRAAITTHEEAPAADRPQQTTVVIDTQSGVVIADLRTFRIEHEGPRLDAPVSISSVAFEHDGDRFFATLASPRESYLAAGSLAEGRLTIIRAGVASEALSDDGRKLIVWRRLPEGWQLGVIDLQTWAERDLRHEPHSTREQVEWLDDQHVMYAGPDGESVSIWMLPVDGASGPRLLLRDAASGAVQR